MKKIDGARKWMVGVGALVGLGLVPQLARAQLAVHPGVSAQAGDQHIRTGIGISLQAGGGVTDFSGSNARDVTNTGGYWDVRAVFGTRSFIGGELAYVGTARGLSNPSLTGSNSTLISNGGEGTLRLQVPFASSGGALVEPFAFGGVGWSTYNFSNLGLGVASQSNSVGTVPVGGGIAFGYRGFIADARFTYRPTFGSSNATFLDGAVDTGGLASWTAGLMLGAEF